MNMSIHKRQPGSETAAARTRGTMHRYRSGERIAQRPSGEHIVAVVRGRVRLEFAAPRTEKPVPLRASDAHVVPAHTAYEIHALEDAIVYISPERTSPAHLHALWGV